MSRFQLGVCPLCMDVVEVLKSGRTRGHYPKDQQLAFQPGWYCRGSNQLAGELGESKRTTFTITWAPETDHRWALDLTRAIASKLSDLPQVHSCRIQNVIAA